MNSNYNQNDTFTPTSIPNNNITNHPPPPSNAPFDIDSLLQQHSLSPENQVTHQGVQVEQIQEGLK